MPTSEVGFWSHLCTDITYSHSPLPKLNQLIRLGHMQSTTQMDPLEYLGTARCFASISLHRTTTYMYANKYGLVFHHDMESHDSFYKRARAMESTARYVQP